MLLVPLQIHQNAILDRLLHRSLLDPYLRHPPTRLRALIHLSRCLLEYGIDLGDDTRDGRVDVGCGLDGLDAAYNVVGRELKVDGGKLDEDNVAELA